jgi:hypothetical protein
VSFIDGLAPNVTITRHSARSPLLPHQHGPLHFARVITSTQVPSKRPQSFSRGGAERPRQRGFITYPAAGQEGARFQSPSASPRLCASEWRLCRPLERCKGPPPRRRFGCSCVPLQKPTFA